MSILTQEKRDKVNSFGNVLLRFLKSNIVLCIAFLLAVITSFLVPPDKEYLGYFDFKTLTCLFCVLAVVCALKNINFFYVLASKIVKIFKNTRACILALVYITFIGSMLIANDMALLTFLPLGFFILNSTDNKQLMAFTFIMQNISANLGGMLTPFGNPQNLYLYTKFNIPTGEFTSIMLAPFVLSIVLITVCCLFIKNKPLKLNSEEKKLPPIRTIIYLLLFAFSIIIVFRVVPYQIGLILIPISILILDRRALKQVDYGLLLTFVMFFIFSGNMARIPVIREFFSGLMGKSPLLVSVLCCQIISNVPSAILLSQFTTDYVPLLIGVNIGGCGTLISSLASLITFKEYVKHNPKATKRYLLEFTLFNFGFLIILTLVSAFIFLVPNFII
ncbi:MAG: citrate transporter [Clostridia bacterium]|nr:citrate transporter [Clostridia bacterium]